MKDKVNQMFKDKLFLVMMVIGLLTAVAAVGVLTVSNTDEKGQSPYLEVPGGEIIAQDSVPETAQKEEKAEEKISEIEASKVPQESYAQKEEKNPNTKDDLAAEAGAGKQFPYLAGKRKCDPGLQYGPDDLFPHSGPV